VINPAWWQTVWFKWMIAFIITGLLGIIVINYNRKKTFALKQQLKVQEEMQKERERISRDLHDNIGAYSTAMIANTEYLEQAVTDKESKAKVAYLKDNAKNILSTIRETIWLLNSKNLTVSGFTDGFINYCTNILRNYDGIEIEFKEEIIQNNPLPPSTAINLLRILQEVIQNIVKHAGANKIECMIIAGEILQIKITDNGKGFPANHLSRLRHGAHGPGIHRALLYPFPQELVRFVRHGPVGGEGSRPMEEFHAKALAAGED
jgi:signal transduction histidine kinase